jgi:hypothetical protein
MTPIIPPWSGPGVEPAQPVRVQPWPPKGRRVEVDDPSDPWSEGRLVPVQERRKQR